MPADASEPSIVKLSSPLPPLTERLATEEIAFDSLVPSTVTTRFAPSTVAEIVCAAVSEVVTVHAAGGARPLAVFVAGSGVELAVALVAPVAPSDCVVGVVPLVEPVVPLDEVPVPAVVPVTPCAAEVSPGCAEVSPLDDVVTTAAVTVPSLEPVGALLIVPASPVLLETCCCVAAMVEASTVPVSPLPTVAVTCGAGGGACEDVSAGAGADVSAGAGELVVAGALASLTENQPMPVSAPVVAAGCVVGGVESAGSCRVGRCSGRVARSGRGRRSRGRRCCSGRRQRHRRADVVAHDGGVCERILRSGFALRGGRSLRMHVRHNRDAMHDLPDVTRTHSAALACARGAVCATASGGSGATLCIAALVLGEGDSRNGERGERNSRCGERRLMECGDDGTDIEGTEHSNAEAGPPVPNPRAQRDQTKRLMRSN